MKNYPILIKTIIDNYNPRNFESDFLSYKTSNIVCIISSDFNKRDVIKLAKTTAKFIRSNYFNQTLILFAWDNNLLQIFLDTLDQVQQFSTFKIKTNLSRTSKIACLSKICELNLQQVLFVCPSYEKQLLNAYLNTLNYQQFTTLCTKANIWIVLNQAYRNFKIITKKQN